MQRWLVGAVVVVVVTLAGIWVAVSVGDGQVGNNLRSAQSGDIVQLDDGHFYSVEKINSDGVVLFRPGVADRMSLRFNVLSDTKRVTDFASQTQHEKWVERAVLLAQGR